MSIRKKILSSSKDVGSIWHDLFHFYGVLNEFEHVHLLMYSC